MLRDRAAATRVAARHHAEHGAGDTAQIEPRIGVKATVFGGDDGQLHYARYLVEGEYGALPLRRIVYGVEQSTVTIVDLGALRNRKLCEISWVGQVTREIHVGAPGYGANGKGSEEDKAKQDPRYNEQESRRGGRLFAPPETPAPSCRIQ